MILSFTTSGVFKSTLIDLDISITDGLLQPITTQSIEDRDIPLLYYSVDAKNIYDYIGVDKTKFGKNRIRKFEAVSGTTGIDLLTSNIDVTDQANIYFDETVPLWYQHYTTSNSIIGAPNVIGMSLYDYNMEEVDSRLWKFDTSTKVLYTNVSNNIDPNSNRHVTYYVSTTYNDQQVSTEILNAHPVFKESSSNAVSKRYTINATSLSILMSISNSAAIYVRENMDKAMDIKVYGDTNSSIWNLAVKNDVVEVDSVIYSIQKSFDSMLFTEAPQIMKILSKRVEIISSSLLYVDLPGRFVTNGLPKVLNGSIPSKYQKIQLIIRNKNGVLKGVYTNYDPQNWVFEDTTGSVEAEFNINSVSANGYIKIFNEVSVDDLIEISGYMFVDYYIDPANIKITEDGGSNYSLYAEEYSRSKRLNTNPSLLITDETPVSINKAADTYTYYLREPFLLDGNFKIKDTDNAITWTIISNVLTPSGLPGLSGTINSTVGSPTYGLVTLVYDTPPPANNSLSTTGVRTTYNRSELTGLLDIGNIYVGKNRTFNTLNFIDIRQRGGGINPKYKETVELLYPESIYFKNINNFSSLDLFMSAGLIVNLPGNLLLNKFNGMFEEQQIKTKVDESMRAAIPGTVRYYNIAPQIESVEYGENTSKYMDITWKDIKGFSYRLHFSYDGSDFNLIKPTPITLLPPTDEDLFNGIYSYRFYYNPPTPNNNLIYVKIEGLYEDNYGNEIAGNFSETYRIIRL